MNNKKKTEYNQEYSLVWGLYHYLAGNCQLSIVNRRTIVAKCQLAAILLLLTGCLKENLADCPTGESNLTLTFRYTGTEGIDLFPGEIEDITVILFDENDVFDSLLELRAEDLPEDHSVEYRIGPGKYTILSWANYKANSGITPLSGNHLNEAHLTHNSREGTDPLYYASGLYGEKSDRRVSSQIEIPVSGNVTHTLDFIPAYHRLNVFVKGLDEKNNSQGVIPVIRLDGLSAGYDFYLSQLEETTVFEQPSVFSLVSHEESEEEEEMAVAGFRIPHFDMEQEITINLLEPSGEHLCHPVSLTGFLKEKGITVPDGGNRTINIVIEFNNGQIIIALFEWSVGDVKPIL